MNISDLLGNFKTRSRKLVLKPEQLLSSFAAGELLRGPHLLQFSKPSAVAPANILHSFNRPLEILFALIVMLLRFALIRKDNYVADAKRARRQFIADL